MGHLTCDGGEVSRHFLLMAGIGLDAHIVYHVNATAESADRQVRLLGGGLEPAGPQPGEFHVEVGGQMRKCSFALASKVRNYGGDFEIARQVTSARRRFEVVLFEGRSTLRYVKYFAG